VQLRRDYDAEMRLPTNNSLKMKMISANPQTLGNQYFPCAKLEPSPKKQPQNLRPQPLNKPSRIQAQRSLIASLGVIVKYPRVTRKSKQGQGVNYPGYSGMPMESFSLSHRIKPTREASLSLAGFSSGLSSLLPPEEL
jgi:hypothetical protein